MIGSGGMGAVYKANQTKLDREVAIKVFSPEFTSNSKFEEGFQLEAKALARLKHNRIVTVYDFGETEDGMLYIVMEFVRGNDLTHLIKAGSLSPQQALAVVTQVCDALNYAHRSNIVHRDIKPANVMLDVEGQVRVADFGLAQMGLPGEGHDAGDSEVTLGSPDYIAPEQLQIGMEADQRADIYSLGVMTYEMLTGRVPRGEYELPSKLNPEVDPRLDAVIAKAMAPDREARYQDVSQFWRDIDQIKNSRRPGPATRRPSRVKKVQLRAGPATGMARKRPVVSQPANRAPDRSPLVISLVITGILAAILAVYFATGSGNDEEPYSVPELDGLSSDFVPSLDEG